MLAFKFAIQCCIADDCFCFLQLMHFFQIPLPPNFSPAFLSYTFWTLTLEWFFTPPLASKYTLSGFINIPSSFLPTCPYQPTCLPLRPTHLHLAISPPTPTDCNWCHKNSDILKLGGSQDQMTPGLVAQM